MSGSVQSPIDIPTTAPRRSEGLTFEYRSTPPLIGANPVAVQVDCAPGSGVVIDGLRYELRQFHLHCPGEHTFAGRGREGELHLVHTSVHDTIAVVGVMLTIGAPSAALAPVVAALAGRGADASVELVDLLPNELEHVAYTGSLTTPPHTEGVAWRVLTEPLEISPEQRHAFEAVHHGNNRPLQTGAGPSFGR